MNKAKIIFSQIFLLILIPTCGAQSDEFIDICYLKEIKQELEKKWPDNHTINLVFHGHSVPAGYWHNSEVYPFDSYPHILLKLIKEEYPHAVVNIIVTAIGGENSVQGQKRMATEVLNHNPDVLFIDYALNDTGLEIKKMEIAWEKMIESALKLGTKVVVVTPSPDQRQDILDPNNPLVLRAELIRRIAKKYKIGIADPFIIFQRKIKNEGSLNIYMSHVNHPNQQGHTIIAKEIMRLFEK